MKDTLKKEEIEKAILRQNKKREFHRLAMATFVIVCLLYPASSMVLHYLGWWSEILHAFLGCLYGIFGYVMLVAYRFINRKIFDEISERRMRVWASGGLGD
jgi:hypothetical protein